MPIPPSPPTLPGRTLLLDALAQSDVDMQFHRLLNLDTSNLPLTGIPPTIHPPQNKWLHDWDVTTQEWSVSQPRFTDLSGILTTPQMLAINQLGTVAVGVWNASPITAPYLPRLNELILPNGNMNFNNKRLTNVAPPIDPNDAVNLAYMDFLLQGLNPKESVLCATTGNISLAVPPAVVDGVTLVLNERILVKNQIAPGDNGIYIIDVPLHRAADADHGSDDPGVTPVNDINRAYCFVRQGTINGGSSWVNNRPVPLIVDPDPSAGPRFALFAAAPSVNIVAGSGLEKVGNTLNVLGTAHRISVGATVDIALDYAGQASITTLGAVTAGDWNAGIILPQFGGTGMDNGLNTIALDHVNLSLERLAGSDNDLVFLVGTGLVTVSMPYSGQMATLDGDEVLTNKRVTKRIGKIASNANPSINVNIIDVFYITNLGADIISMTTNLTGIPFDGQELIVWIRGSSASFVKHINWGVKFDASPDLPLPTVAQNQLWIFNRFVYNTEKLKWVLADTIGSIPE